MKNTGSAKEREANANDPGHPLPVVSEFSRDLSVFHLTMMGIGMMIGAGVFLGLGNSIREAGPGGAVLTFGINGILALFTAMSYAELSSAMPKAGGTYNFARLAFGRGTSFIAGWLQWFASTVAGSMYALTFAIYVVRFIEQLGWLAWCPIGMHILERLVAVAVALAFVRVNYRGASEAGKVGAFFTLGQMAILLVIGGAGVIVCLYDPQRLANFHPFLPNGWTRLLATLGFTYVAFEGFEVIAQAGDEAINPCRSLPRAMLYSVLAVTGTYLLVSFATVVAVKPGLQGVTAPAWQWIGQFGAKGFGEAVSRLMPLGSLLLTLAVVFAATSALNATIYSATRSAYALGRDSLLPPVLGQLALKHRTPWASLAATAAILLVVAAFLPTLDVAASASIMFLFLFLLTNACAIRMRRHMREELTYGFQTPFFPLIPVVAILCQVMLAVWLVRVSWIAWTIAPLWLGVGFIVYHGYSKRRAQPVEGEVLVLEEEQEAPQPTNYRVLVALANPLNALGLVRTTYHICSAKNASMELLHMVPVPGQVPLSDASRYMRPGEDGLAEAMLYLDVHFPVSRTIRYCRNIARGIVSTVREKRADMLIMGWRSTTRLGFLRPGSLIDPVLRLAPANVVIMKGCPDRKVETILVPIAGGRNAALALEVAGMLADRAKGRIVIFNVITPKRPFSAEKFLIANRHLLPLPDNRISVKAVPATDVVTAITAEAWSYDLAVMGCSSEPFHRHIITKTIPAQVMERFPKPVILVRAAGGVKGVINKWV